MQKILKDNIDKNNLAIGGYDPVSYFELIQSPPYLGNKDIKSEYNGSIYYFRNTKNKELFDKNPDIYIPQYGGYCATAISEGQTAPIDPKTFIVDDNKLYLFYNDIYGGDTTRDRNANPQNRKKSADSFWSKNEINDNGGGIVFSSFTLFIKNLFR